MALFWNSRMKRQRTRSSWPFSIVCTIDLDCSCQLEKCTLSYRYNVTNYGSPEVQPLPLWFSILTCPLCIQLCIPTHVFQTQLALTNSIHFFKLNSLFQTQLAISNSTRYFTYFKLNSLFQTELNFLISTHVFQT